MNFNDPTGEYGVFFSALPPIVLGNGLSFGFGLSAGAWSPVPIFIPAFFQPPPVVAAATEDQVKSKSGALYALNRALNKLDPNCIRQLGSLSVLKVSAGNVRFWDARRQADGLLSASNVVPGASNARLMDLNYGAYAYVINVGKRITNHIVLRGDFFLQSRRDQDITLVHELLHVHFKLDDDGVARKFGFYERSDSSSARISEWLKNGCDKAKMK